MDEVLDYTQDLRLLTREAAHGTVAQAVEGALASLERLVAYDLAAVLQLEGSHLAVRYARGRLADDRVRHHSVDLTTHPRLRQALADRVPLAITEDIHRSEGDPYDGVLDLPEGHSCMVVPLYAGEQAVGALTLDRAVCEVYPRQIVELVGVYGDIIALVISCAEQADLLDRYRRQLEAQNRLLIADSPSTQAARSLQESRSPSMRELVGAARLVAATAAPVLITGETGVGKEVLAHALHEWSPRHEGPFVALNCAAIPENLVESELFGHVRGAFSGADRDRDGRFLTANGGTLLLDEIGDLPLIAQGKLLRVLQEGTFEPVGSDHTVKVDVRVVAATHVDLEQAIADKTFREDLYYRLSVFPLAVPSLRDRREDIVAIARRLLQGLEQAGGGPWTLTAAAAAALESRDWPGNVRQLRNALERATILQRHGALDAALFQVGETPVVQAREGPLVPLDEVVRAHIERVLQHTRGRIYGGEGAAAVLGLAPSTLQARMRKLGIDHTRFR